MRLVALDSFDNRHEGEEFEAPDKQGQQLIDKGLARAGDVPQNKMATPLENKADPSEAAGEAQQSSASQAAPASPSPTARPSAAGAQAPAKKTATKKATKKVAKKAASKKKGTPPAE